ncbi:MAG: nuclear transport factor 2 family protein [Rhodothalassiaceae bacterium]
MNILRIPSASVILLTLLMTAFTARAGEENEAAVRAVILESAEAWNRGDLEGFMASYWHSDDLRFASGNSVIRGHDATLARYRARYGDDRESMGHLSFGDLETLMLCEDAATVFGRYVLVRSDGTHEGLFTLLLRRVDGAWKIVADHTSSE